MRKLEKTVNFINHFPLFSDKNDKIIGYTLDFFARLSIFRYIFFYAKPEFVTTTLT